MRILAAVAILACLPVLGQPLAAQQWQGGDIELIDRAIEARLRRDADTVLAGWQAVARGMVRFTAEIDHGHGPIERVIRADELRVEVYGEAPNRSKQVITAWRDTTFQPTGIVYHRDHLGIIANDFGPVIRLGEGEEVRDVPHPLSEFGKRWYEYALGDTLVVSAPSGSVRVVRVEVRPRDPETAGIVGAMLIDTDRAALVELSFSFTAASYRDATVSAITVRLQNALHQGQRWLPWRQAISIRRAAPIMVLPLATMIRADWTIDDYELDLRHPAALFRGAAIDGLRRPTDSAWTAPWSSAPDALNDQAVENLAAIPAMAADLIPASFLSGIPRLRLLAQGGLSRLLHVNRVQGVTFGAGLRWQAPWNARVDLAGGFGTADQFVTAQGEMSFLIGKVRISLAGAREIRDMHAWPRRSGLANSVATVVDGTDAGDWYLAEESGLGAVMTPSPGTRLSLRVMHRTVTGLESRFTALNGDRMANPDLSRGGEFVGEAEVSSLRSSGRGFAIGAEAGGWDGAGSWWRGRFEAAGSLPAGFQWRLRAGAGGGNLPRYRAFAIGGAGSLPGTVPRAIGGKRMALLELSRAWQVAVPAPVGTRIAGNVLNSRLAPFVAVGVAGVPMSGLPWSTDGTPIPVVGMRLDLWGPLLQVEAGWSPRSGGFSVRMDAHPDWWPLL